MPLSNPVSDGVGQRCVIMKVTGDLAAGNIYYAIRTSGPYLTSDGATIRSGAGAVFTAQLPNISRQYALAVGLDSGTVHYWGAVLDSGLAVAAQFTTDLDALEESNVIPVAGLIT